MIFQERFLIITNGVEVLTDPVEVACEIQDDLGATVESTDPTKISDGIFEVELDDDLYTAEAEYAAVWTFAFVPGQDQQFSKVFTFPAGGAGGSVTNVMPIVVTVEDPEFDVTVEVDMP